MKVKLQVREPGDRDFFTLNEGIGEYSYVRLAKLRQGWIDSRVFDPSAEYRIDPAQAVKVDELAAAAKRDEEARVAAGELAATSSRRTRRTMIRELMSQ